MRVEVELNASASPDQVLSSIHENTREWRESAIPSPLFEMGISRVVSHIKGTSFYLAYERRWTVNGQVALRLRGTVCPGTDGQGARLVARCGKRSIGAQLTALFFVAAAVNNTIRGGGTSWWVWLLLAAIWLFIDEVNYRGVDLTDPQTAYLVERLRQAVAEADEHRAPTS